MPDGTYAGELTSAQAYEMLKQDGRAVLVDVRTTPEWQFVGVPDLRDLGRTPVFQSWQIYPRMDTSKDFGKALKDSGIEPDDPVLLLCRSGVRSRSAAMALAAEGFSRAYNVSDGFEGPLDTTSHRGQVCGWKASGLPWVQQ